MKKSIVLFFATVTISIISFAQPANSVPAQYWQQAVKYNMNIDMDVNTNRFTGKKTVKGEIVIVIAGLG